MSRDNKITCLRCFQRKERIDRLERDLLMCQAWEKHLRADITEIHSMINNMAHKLEQAKMEWEEEFIGCIEE